LPSLPLPILHHPLLQNHLALKQWKSEMMTWCWRIEQSQCKTMCCSLCLPAMCCGEATRIL
jgi:hypothetical protein